MCFGAQFVVDTSGIFDENAAGLCFSPFWQTFNIQYIYIFIVNSSGYICSHKQMLKVKLREKAQNIWKTFDFLRCFAISDDRISKWLNSAGWKDILCSGKWTATLCSACTGIYTCVDTRFVKDRSKNSNSLYFQATSALALEWGSWS